MAGVPTIAFVAIAGRFDAPFFSMDIAQTEAGAWIIVDMGAGEVSSLPPNLSPERFYGKLAAAIGFSARISDFLSESPAAASSPGQRP